MVSEIKKITLFCIFVVLCTSLSFGCSEHGHSGAPKQQLGQTEKNEVSKLQKEVGKKKTMEEEAFLEPSSAQLMSLGNSRTSLHKLLSSRYGSPFCDLQAFTRIPLDRGRNLLRESFSGYDEKGEVYDSIMRLLDTRKDTVVMYGEFDRPQPLEYTPGVAPIRNFERIMHIPVPKDYSGFGLEGTTSGYTLDLNEIVSNSYNNTRCQFARCCSGTRGKCCYCTCMSTSCGSCVGDAPDVCPWQGDCGGCGNQSSVCRDLDRTYWSDLTSAQTLKIGDSL